MALPHALPMSVIDLSPLGAALPDAVSTSLIRIDGLQLMRLVLRAGATMPQHAVSGPLSIQSLEGAAEITTPTQVCSIEQGQVIVLPDGENHSIMALSDCSLLVTLVAHAH